MGGQILRKSRKICFKLFFNLIKLHKYIKIIILCKINNILSEIVF